MLIENESNAEDICNSQNNCSSIKVNIKIMSSPEHNKREKTISENNGSTKSFLPNIRQKITITNGNDYGSPNAYNNRKYWSNYKQMKDVGVGCDTNIASNYNSAEPVESSNYEQSQNIILPKFEHTNSSEEILNSVNQSAIDKIDKAIGIFANSGKSRDNTEFRSCAQPKANERMHNFCLESGRSFEPDPEAIIYHDEMIKPSKLNHPKLKSVIKNCFSVSPQVLIKSSNEPQQIGSMQKLSKSSLLKYEKGKWSNKKMRKLAGFGKYVPYESTVNH